MDDSLFDRPVPLRTVLLVALLTGTVASVTTLLLARTLVPALAVGAGTTSATPTTSAPLGTMGDTPRSPFSATGPSAEALVDIPGERSDDETMNLREALALAEAERSQLAGTLLDLSRRSETIEQRLAALDGLTGDALASATLDADEAASLPSGETGEILVSGTDDADEPAPRERRLGERDSLIAAGLDPQSVDELKRRRDEFELSRLALLDRAAREGWLESERLDQSLEALEQSRPDLREELGDEAYDRYLFERGRSNRVGVASVMSGSVAEQAGLVQGDIIVSYAGQRVFRTPELQSATREGRYGEPVQVSVQRDGELVAIDVPRGPLGVQLNTARRSPG